MLYSLVYPMSPLTLLISARSYTSPWVQMPTDSSPLQILRSSYSCRSLQRVDPRRLDRSRQKHENQFRRMVTGYLPSRRQRSGKGQSKRNLPLRKPRLPRNRPSRNQDLRQRGRLFRDQPEVKAAFQRRLLNCSLMPKLIVHLERKIRTSKTSFGKTTKVKVSTSSKVDTFYLPEHVYCGQDFLSNTTT